MRTLTHLIPPALQAVERYLALPAETPGQTLRTVPGEYDGYAASLGASVATAGLLPTLAFYTDIHKIKKDAPQQVRRYKILQALLYVLQPQAAGAAPYAENEMLFWTLEKLYGPPVQVRNPGVTLPPLAAGQTARLSALEKDILAAATALKLALRNFKQTEANPADDRP